MVGEEEEGGGEEGKEGEGEVVAGDRHLDSIFGGHVIYVLKLNTGEEEGGLPLEGGVEADTREDQSPGANLL